MRALEHEQRSHTKGVDGLKGKSQRRQIWIKKVSLTEDTYCYDCWIVATKPVKKGSAHSNLWNFGQVPYEPIA